MQGKIKETGIVLEQREIAAGIHNMWIQTQIAARTVPGQFLCLYTRDKSALLPRPISVCETDPAGERLRIVYRVAGQGTREFSGYRKGDAIEVMGPLGNGFPLEDGGPAFVIGGGIGIPPLLELAKKLPGEKKIILGYRDELYLEKEFQSYGEVYVATEDGSAGTRGNVLDAVRENGLSAGVIYACGPMPMLKAVSAYAKEKQIRAYISLEERMACGVGACLGCICKTKKRDSHTNVFNKRICTDGPVFAAEEVDFS